MAKRLQPSVIDLQGEYLRILAEVSPKTVTDVFNRAFDLFNALRIYPVKLLGFENSIADYISYGSLREDEFWGLSSNEPRAALKHVLTEWGKEHSLQVDWCYDHAIDALKHFKATSISPETAKHAWLDALKTLPEKIKKQSTPPESVMIWRSAVSRSSPERTKDLPPIEAPEPPPGFPPRAIRFSPPMTRSEYEDKVKETIVQSFLDVLTVSGGWWKFLPYELQDSFIARYKKLLKTLAIQIFKQRRGEFDRYCDEYDEHLKKYGWIEVPDKREFERHCRWLIFYLCERKTDNEIAQLENVQEEVTVRKGRTEVAHLIGLPLPEKKERRTVLSKRKK